MNLAVLCRARVVVAFKGERGWGVCGEGGGGGGVLVFFVCFFFLMTVRAPVVGVADGGVVCWARAKPHTQTCGRSNLRSSVLSATAFRLILCVGSS